MNKPIIENGYFNFNNLIYFIKKSSKSCFKYSFYTTLLFLVYFFIKTPTYSSKLSFYTNYKDLNQSSLLSPFIGDITGLDESGLSFSISEFLESDRFLEDIVKKKYIINGKNTSLVEYWGVHYNNYFTMNPWSLLQTINRNIMFTKTLNEKQRSLSFSKEVLGAKIFHSENRRSGLNTVTIIVKGHPSLSKQINKEVYLAVLDYANQINNIKANEKITFIQERLNEVRSNLHDSEEKMLEFVVENKNFQSSPALTLDRSRIQRDINSYNQIYLNLLDQYELAKIDSKDNTSSVFYLDKEVLNSSKEGISLLKGVVLTFICASILFLILKFYRRRKMLFI